MPTTTRQKSGVKTGLDASEITVYMGILGSYLRDCNHPERDYLESRLAAMDFASLLAWTERPSPQMYGSSALYLADAQIAALIKKYPFLPHEVPGLNPELTAVEKFIAAEHRCKRVNQRYRARRNNRRFVPNADFWQTARAYIERVIGREPNLPSILRQCDFTAGASIGVHGNATNQARKIFAQDWSCTPTALPYAITALWLNTHLRDCILPGAIVCYDPDVFRGLVRAKVRRVDCNNITFVPKSAKTHRSIAVEPLLNGFVQKGVDEELRSLLRRVNIDLSDQTPNQVLAYAGSLGGPNPYCTIDLAAASDSLAIEVVRDLVPPDWFDFLTDVRSPWYTLHGKTRRYEKFCSMGNGFCFPLQSLIFAAVCHASLVQSGNSRSDFAVYGDDIVVPQNVALLVIERLRDLGFSTNRDKTFVTGPFRESCGRDWYQGQDVRPVNLDKRMSDVRQLCAFHNSTYRSDVLASSFEGVRAYLRTFRPHLMRPGVEPGDTCFSVPLDLAMTSPWVRWRRDSQNWSWVEIASKPVQDRLSLTVEQHAKAALVAILRGAKPGKLFPLRYTTRPRKVVVSRPWLDEVRTPFGVGREIVLFPACRRYRKLQRALTGSWFVASCRRET